MTHVIKFPISQKQTSPLPRQRVFYIGYRYVGPMFCQDVQQLYLKRKGLLCGTRRWSLVTYGKYDESDNRTYSIELEECEEEAVLNLLERFEVRDEVTLAELHEMGWRGKGDHSAEIKSFFHKCYDGLRFPAFVEPLKRWSFGTKIMAQGRSARDQLEGKSLYAHTVFGAGDDGWIWMNLAQLDSPNTKPVPVRIVGELPPEVRCLNVRKVS